MQLVTPNIDYIQSFLNAVKEFRADKKSKRAQYYKDLDLNSLESNFSEYLSNISAQSRGESLPAGYVPQTTYWLVDEEEFIGRVSIRHTLTDHLLKEGGHIGYDIRPSKRNQGYGKAILKLALEKARALGINPVLVTCDEDNIPSKKIIEHNGGVQEDVYKPQNNQPNILRYWISL